MAYRSRRGMGDASTCACGPPGYCFSADFCSVPRLDSHGRDFRTDASAGSMGPTNSTMIGIGVAAIAAVFFLFGGGR